MAAGQYNMTISQGESFGLLLTLADSSDDPIDLTGCMVRGQIRENASSSPVLASFTAEIQDPETLGQVQISLTAAETAAIPVPATESATKTSVVYAYDLELVYANGSVKRLLEGLCTVSPEVTRV
jgi:hypothetical protein